VSAFIQLSNDSLRAEEPGRAPAGLEGMIGQSLVMQRLFARLRQAAPHLRVAAIEGEPGTGKMLAARTLHTLGPASGAAFTACPAAHFLLSETQALLEEVRGGTLYLNRLADLTSEQQSRFIDFLEWWEHRSGRDINGIFPRQLFVGSSKPLRQLSVSGELRTDLCYRLTAIRFELPPLRDRRDDIPALAESFAIHHGAVHGKTMRGLGPGSLARLFTHSWPGNVRELETIMANAVMDCAGQWIRPIDIPPLVQSASALRPQISTVAPSEDDPNLDRMILRHITHVLARTRGNKLRASQLLGISRSTLYRLLESGSLASHK